MTYGKASRLLLVKESTLQNKEGREPYLVRKRKSEAACSSGLARVRNPFI
jgi:hypothetical protein